MEEDGSLRTQLPRTLPLGWGMGTGGSMLAHNVHKQHSLEVRRQQFLERQEAAGYSRAMLSSA